MTEATETPTPRKDWIKIPRAVFAKYQSIDWADLVDLAEIGTDGVTYVLSTEGTQIRDYAVMHACDRPNARRACLFAQGW